MAAVKAFIGMGSNLGDGISILAEAWKSIGDIEEVELLTLSSPYRTEPVDMSSNHWFTNSVGRIETELAPAVLLERLLQVEQNFGRTREVDTFGYQDRPLDLDLLYFGREIIDTPDLILPHPRIKDRLFVLVPLLELAPDYKDPLSGVTVREMEDSLKRGIVEKTFKHQEIIRGKWED